MGDALIPLLAVIVLFIGLPWLIFHYVTRWKQASSLTIEDENLLDELHEMALRLEERMQTIERLVAADQAERQDELALRPVESGPAAAPPAITDGAVERRDIRALRAREQRI